MGLTLRYQREGAMSTPKCECQNCREKKPSQSGTALISKRTRWICKDCADVLVRKAKFLPIHMTVVGDSCDVF